SRTQRLGRTLNSSHNRSHVALVDVNGFDPKDITVMVKDGKVTVSGEHKEEHNTSVSKTCKYRKFIKEFNLPPGVSEDEVTYSL
ncbi:ODFP1 protein, partial [Formicarius rufipectus]|nr:ODFP1 protein [Formicarius rufipectus]